MPDRLVPGLSWAQASARRLDRHALSAPLADAEPADVVAAMCGAHAQLLTAAEWSIGLRLAAVTRGDVQAALWTGRSLVKTFGPRGTVHLLPTRDLPLWTGAMSAVPSVPNSFAKDVRLTPGQADAVIEAIADALADAELTTDELTDAVVVRTGAWAGDLVMPAFQGMWPRWRQVLPLAGIRGALCFGPNRGRKVTFTSPRRWLPGFRPAAAQPAVAGLVRRRPRMIRKPAGDPAAAGGGRRFAGPENLVGIARAAFGPGRRLTFDDGATVIGYLWNEAENYWPAAQREHYRWLRASHLDDRRIRFYRLALYLSLSAGPLRLLDGDYPDREPILEIVEYNITRVLACL
jgi:hypothetical protein